MSYCVSRDGYMASMDSLRDNHDLRLTYTTCMLTVYLQRWLDLFYFFVHKIKVNRLIFHQGSILATAQVLAWRSPGNNIINIFKGPSFTPMGDTINHICLRSQSADRASVFCRLGFHHCGTRFTCIHRNPC